MPVAALPLIAALTPPQHRVTLIDENGADTGVPYPIERTFREWQQSDFSVAGDGFLDKTLVADLLDIADPDGFTVAEPAL